MKVPPPPAIKLHIKSNLEFRSGLAKGLLTVSNWAGRAEFPVWAEPLNTFSVLLSVSKNYFKYFVQTWPPRGFGAAPPSADETGDGLPLGA